MKNFLVNLRTCKLNTYVSQNLTANLNTYIHDPLRVNKLLDVSIFGGLCTRSVVEV